MKTLKTQPEARLMRRSQSGVVNTLNAVRSRNEPLNLGRPGPTVGILSHSKGISLRSSRKVTVSFSSELRLVFDSQVYSDITGFYYDDCRKRKS